MEALGIIGLNLIHCGVPPPRSPQALRRVAAGQSAPGRVEVDLLKFTGHGYGFFDNRLCALQLVESDLTEATMFLPNGEVVQPAEALYRHPVLLLRGSFDPVINLHLAMLEQSRAGFSRLARGEGPRFGNRAVRNLDAQPAARPGHRSGGFPRSLGRPPILGKTVLVSRCAEFHRIAAFLNRCTTNRSASCSASACSTSCSKRSGRKISPAGC